MTDLRRAVKWGVVTNVAFGVLSALIGFAVPFLVARSGVDNLFATYAIAIAIQTLCIAVFEGGGNSALLAFTGESSTVLVLSLLKRRLLMSVLGAVTGGVIVWLYGLAVPPQHGLEAPVLPVGAAVGISLLGSFFYYCRLAQMKHGGAQTIQLLSGVLKNSVVIACVQFHSRPAILLWGLVAVQAVEGVIYYVQCRSMLRGLGPFWSAPPVPDDVAKFSQASFFYKMSGEVGSSRTLVPLIGWMGGTQIVTSLQLLIDTVSRTSSVFVLPFGNLIMPVVKRIADRSDVRRLYATSSVAVSSVAYVLATTITVVCGSQFLVHYLGESYALWHPLLVALTAATFAELVVRIGISPLVLKRGTHRMIWAGGWLQLGATAACALLILAGGSIVTAVVLHSTLRVAASYLHLFTDRETYEAAIPRQIAVAMLIPVGLLAGRAYLTGDTPAANFFWLAAAGAISVVVFRREFMTIRHYFTRPGPTGGARRF